MVSKINVKFIYSLVGKTNQLNKLCQYKIRLLHKGAVKSVIATEKEVGKGKQLSYIETSRMKSWPGKEGNVSQLRGENISHSRS